MYNPQQKEEYIHFLLNLRTDNQSPDTILISQKSFFNRLGKVEQEFDIDVAEADYETVMMMLSLFCKGKSDSRINDIVRLRKYVDWCILHEKTTISDNKLDLIKPEDINISQSYKVSMVKDESQLLEYLNTALRQTEEDTIDNLYRVYCLLLFMGIPAKIALNVKEADVDMEQSCIHVLEDIVPFSEQAGVYIQKLISMDGYIQPNKNGMSIKEKSNGGYLLEFTKPNRAHISSYCRIALSHFNARYRELTQRRLFLSSTNIFNSGIFSRMYENECRTGDVDLSEYNRNYRTGTMTKEMAKYRDKLVRVDYETWKTAFYL